jgi:hypothetical protein
MWENPTYQFSLKLEHFEILRILVAILKMAAKMTFILKSHWSRSHSSKKKLNINFLCNWSIEALRKKNCVLATILKIAAIAAIMVAIFKSHLPNFELKLEIPNIMLVCKFEINWSTNKNLRALTTYLGRTD